jgi:predicted DNA-binding transcriptional regulator AlpA
MANLRFKELKPAKGIPFCRQHIKRLQKAKKFPLPIPYGENTEVYDEAEIDQWKADRKAERDAKAAALTKAAEQQESENA